jgi:hypothetical protein
MSIRPPSQQGRRSKPHWSSTLLARWCGCAHGRIEPEQLRSGRRRQLVRRFIAGPTKFLDRFQTTAQTRSTRDGAHGEVDLRNRHQQNFTQTFDNPLRYSFLIIHGENDNVVPVEHARLFIRASGANFDQIESGEKSVWMVLGTGHNASFRTEATAYIERFVKFYEAHLGASRSSYQSSVLSDDDSVESPTVKQAGQEVLPEPILRFQ